MITNLANSFSTYAAQLRDFIRTNSRSGAESSSDIEFNLLALELFALQFAHNAPYRQFCEARKIVPQNINHWRDIPAIPAAGFKELELTSLPTGQRAHVFHSSGTTEQSPSRHFHNNESLSIYETSLLPWFREHLLSVPGGPAQFLILTPPPAQVTNSSLVYMFETIRHEYGTAASIFLGQTQIDGVWNLDFNHTLTTLRAAIAANNPLIILGTAFSFVHLLDYLKSSDQRIILPTGSSVLETGGYKGRSRTMPKLELHALITELLGVPASHIVCEYGMSELSSQAYDSVTGQAQSAGRRFRFPPWARAQIISPETGREVGESETGLIRVFDLANVYSVTAIQTEDLGIRRGGGFELLGRAALSEPRGCSLQSN